MRTTITIIVLIVSTCVAGVTPYDDVNDFIAATVGPLHTIDFESLGDSTTVPLGNYPIDGNEWSNWGVQFAPIEIGYSLILSAKEGMNVSPTGAPGHALAIADLSPGDDRSSFLITFSTPVVSFGVYIVDNETGGPDAYPTERIILKDDTGIIIGEFPMPGGAGPADPPDIPIAKDFIGYISDIPIAEIQIIEANDDEGMLLDNVMFIPEPGTILLLGLGGQALLRRRDG
jgi:hypothetical protein